MSILHLDERDHQEPPTLEGAELGRMAEAYEVMNAPLTWRDRMDAFDAWMDNHPWVGRVVATTFVVAMIILAINLP